MSKTVNCWNDMRQFGVEYLTGEACAYSMRGLCDLSEKGSRLMTAFLGMHDQADHHQFARPWNSRVNGAPAVASVMLSYGILKELATFAMLNDGAQMVMVFPNGCVQGTYTTEETQSYEEYIERNEKTERVRVFRQPRDTGQIRAGDRNMHAMSLRAI